MKKGPARQPDHDATYVDYHKPEPMKLSSKAVLDGALVGSIDMLRMIPITCGACGKVECAPLDVVLADGRPVYALPAGWARYPDCDDDHIQCDECEAEPF